VRVLDELSDNITEIKKQKKRIMKGKEELNRSIEAKHKEQERGAKRNQVLEDDCERIERQCNGLKEKFERFKVSDNDKFHSILALHKDDLQQLQDELDESRDVIFGSEIGCV
jgi:chromosome segregation ATPase